MKLLAVVIVLAHFTLTFSIVKPPEPSVRVQTVNKSEAEVISTKLRMIQK